MDPRQCTVGYKRSAASRIKLGAYILGSHCDHASASPSPGSELQGEVRIKHVANVATSFPGFDTLARGTGSGLRTV
ncbi:MULTISPECIES: hypothetical protein [unclassified Xanthomonas]|uniref:hypothetical protein n=1 Tax=Xanthomonas sp. LMG 9002 TaxID=1591158 RepID=UPI0014214691|nr:hypothetical protein [Xanthomonas sp. LMG 9002]